MGKKFYETKEGYDVIIYAGEKSYIKEFHTHSFVLRTQSKFLKRNLLQNMVSKKKDDYFIINSNNSPEVFEINFKMFQVVGIYRMTLLQFCDRLQYANLSEPQIYVDHSFPKFY
ncbi:BTB/POZ protein [Rhizophagus irregularis DAOM 181602=DAOM 197198]|nr:BTB/POZ protein [Rhizophagus irregularis DAOM 181602=DAOM 197198]